MFKITVVPAPLLPLTISAFNMKVGQIGRSTDGKYYLRTANRVVSLTDPSIEYSETWTSPRVEALRPGDVVSLVIGFDQETEDHIRSLRTFNKIEAIKHVRELTNWDLKTSKDYVDNL